LTPPESEVGRAVPPGASQDGPVWDNPLSGSVLPLPDVAPGDVPSTEVAVLTVDIIVVTYDSADEIAGCLESARASAGRGRLIVVDNASRDDSVAVARRAGAEVVVENRRNLGFARAVNLGLRQATADLVLLLNPDAVLTGDALARLVEALAADGRVAMAGPLLVAEDGRVIFGGRRFSTAVNRLLWHLPMPRRPRWTTPEYEAFSSPRVPAAPVPVDYLWGAALLCRRAFLLGTGGLDERFFLYSEDEDLGRRARRQGLLSLVVPEATVRHVGGASTSDAALAQARIEISNGLLLEKWEGPRAARLFRVGIGPALGLRALLLALAGRGDEARLAWRTLRLIGAPAAPPEA